MARSTDRLRLAPAKSRPLPRGGGAHFPPSPNFPTKSRPPPAGGNGNPPATESRQTVTSRLPSVCPECGGVYERDDNTAACPECKPSRTSRPNHHRRGTPTARGYDYRWRKLSERARRMSPQCEDCGSVEDLTADHSAAAWHRHERGLAIRLEDIAVVCRRCNSERGAARGARGSDHVKWERPDLNQLAEELARDDD